MKALVIGASGGFGRAVASELISRGMETTALVRPGGRDPHIRGIWQVSGDALDQNAVQSAARGMDVIVFGFNIPYPGWESTSLRAITIVAEVAAAEGCTVLFPGNVYGLGPDFDRPLAEGGLREAPSRLGVLRNRMEAVLEQATREGARVIILRAGDYLGPGATNTWFEMMVKRARAGGAILDPGAPGIPHAWAYLPDLALVAVELLEHADELAPFEEVHFEGHAVTPVELMTAIRGALGDPSRRVKRFPWWALRLIAPFSGTVRAVLSLRYLWQKPVLLDNTRLRRLLGVEPRTPLERAIRSTLAVSDLRPDAALPVVAVGGAP